LGRSEGNVRKVVLGLEKRVKRHGDIHNKEELEEEYGELLVNMVVVED
jgi:hypothetical protein